METPLVSVIMPTHNRLAYLREAMATVLQQDYAHLELIIIDDGSTDGTQAAMHNFHHPKVHYHALPNRGPAGARNAGLRLAHGSLVTFLDSDDLWEDNKVSAQVRQFQLQPQLGMLATNFKYVDSNRHPVSDPAKPYGYQIKDFIGDILDIEFPMATSTMMVRRDVFDKVGLFDETLRISEDLDLWVRIGLAFPVAYLDQVLVSIRLHDEHLMRRTPRYQVWMNSAHVLETHRAAIGARVPLLDAKLARFYANAATLALLAGHRVAAIRACLVAMRRQPLASRGYKDLLRCLLPTAYVRRRHERYVDRRIHPLMQLYR
jgi:glycosyltransferase involved in cell wall biosynthesis